MASELRAEFMLDPEVVYLDHGCYGACPLVVFERYQAWQAELERRPVEFLGRRLEGLLAEARAAFATYVGAQADDLVFVENTTAGINVAARALDLRPGDEVLSTDLEYGALNYMWERICAQADARFVRAPVRLPASGADEIADAVWAQAGPRTKAVFVSHVTSSTALVLPAAELCRRACEAGVVSIVDGAHVPGQVPLDLSSFGADVYVGNCHKWLCAPKGAGFLHVRPEWQERVDGVITSWGYEEPATFISRTERQGTRDSAAYLSVPAALAFFREHDVRERCVALCREARRDLCALLRTDPIAPEAMVLQMASVRLPAPDTGLNRRLFDERRIEIPVSDDGTLLRLSIAGYNDRHDVDRLLDALA